MCYVAFKASYYAEQDYIILSCTLRGGGVWEIKLTARLICPNHLKTTTDFGSDQNNSKIIVCLNLKRTLSRSKSKTLLSHC